MANTGRRLPLRARVLDIAVRLLVPLVGIGLLTAGLVGVTTFAVLPFVEALASRNWVPVAASVENVELGPPRVAIPMALDVVSVRYHYEFDGRQYVATQFGPHGGLESHSRSLLFAESAAPGASITVWVDGANPARAMVHRDLNWRLIALSLPALLLCGVGFLMVLVGMMIWNDRRSLLRRLRSR